jgi:hypothetical protein
MKSTFICHHCGKSVPRDPRTKKQKYCSSRACQNARRLTSNKARANKSSECRSLRKDRNKRWRDTYPAYEYQKDYRETHPEYVKRNGDLQRERNKKRQKESLEMIVKTYAIAPQPLRDGVYAGFEVKNKKIVKTYAYMAQRLTQPGLGAVFSSNPV